MGWATGVMVYLVIWWTVLFAILPLGVKRVENPGRGQDRGAPERPQLLRKAVITSIVAAVLWLGFYFLHQMDVLTPIEETLRAFEDLVRAGKVLYPGLSNHSAWLTQRGALR